jgi:hypothetical protein
MNRPAGLVIRVLALGAVGTSASLVLDALDGGGAGNADIGGGLLVVVALGVVAAGGALLDARRESFGGVLAQWAAAGAVLGLLLGVTEPLRHGEWHHGVDLATLWPDALVVTLLLAVIVTGAALVGAAVGTARGPVAPSESSSAPRR